MHDGNPTTHSAIGGWLKIGCLVVIGVFASWYSYAQAPPACAEEQKLLTSLESALQTATDNLQKPTCAGSAVTVCQQK